MATTIAAQTVGEAAAVDVLVVVVVVVAIRTTAVEEEEVAAVATVDHRPAIMTTGDRIAGEVVVEATAAAVAVETG